MHTSELQYGQVNNVLISFNTSNLPIGIFSSFKFEKLHVSSSSSTIDKALETNLHDKTIVVKIDWGKYTMKQVSEYFTLSVKYNDKEVDALTAKFRINFEKIHATSKFSISSTQVMWEKDMYVDLIIEPDHSQSEMWKFLPETKDIRIPVSSKFKPVDGKNEVQFNVLKKKVITLKYEHTTSTPQPITTNQSDKIVALVDNKRRSFDVEIVPNNSPKYSINLIRLKHSYTIGSNDLDLWKLQIIDENPYALLSVKIDPDSQLLKAKRLGELEWIISLTSADVFRRLPSSDIASVINVRVSHAQSKKIGLRFSTTPNDDVRYVNIVEGRCLQLEPKDEITGPIVVYKNDPLKVVFLTLKNTSSSVVVNDIVVSSNNDSVKIRQVDGIGVSLHPNQSTPISALVYSDLTIGRHTVTLDATGECSQKSSYELEIEVREKSHCSLSVGVVKDSFVETFAGERYTKHKVCEIRLTACVDKNYGIEGSLPILISDIKVSQTFSIRTNAREIKPGETIECDLMLNGIIEPEDSVSDFNKLIAFKYEHK